MGKAPEAVERQEGGKGVRMLIEHDPGEEDHLNLGSQEEARTHSRLHQRRTRR